MAFKVFENETTVEVVDVIGNEYIIEKTEDIVNTVQAFAMNYGSNKNNTTGEHIKYILNNNIKFVLKKEVEKYRNNK